MPLSLKKKRYWRYNKRNYLKSIKGDNVYCAICSSKFKIFAPFGLSKRENARCHSCNSLERHRLMYLENKLQFLLQIN